MYLKGFNKSFVQSQHDLRTLLESLFLFFDFALNSYSIHQYRLCPVIKADSGLCRLGLRIILKLSSRMFSCSDLFRA